MAIQDCRVILNPRNMFLAFLNQLRLILSYFGLYLGMMSGKQMASWLENNKVRMARQCKKEWEVIINESDDDSE